MLHGPRSVSNGEVGLFFPYCRNCSKYLQCGNAWKWLLNSFFIKEHDMTYCALTQALLVYKYAELSYKMH